ncbi:MAG: NUDIX hydrolase [Dehalococcoidia bacterium]|nr:NUDIX hydrolase [Dehalococcoidia bacterium]
MDLRNNEPCPVCGRYRNRRIAVDAIILKGESILLIKRRGNPFRGMWALPGGGIEFDETAEEALKKEVEEEVGLSIKTARFLRVYTDPRRDPNQVITLSYLVIAEGKPEAGSDAASYQFFPLDALPEAMAFDHRQIIQDYLDGDIGETDLSELEM